MAAVAPSGGGNSELIVKMGGWSKGALVTAVAMAVLGGILMGLAPLGGLTFYIGTADAAMGLIAIALTVAAHVHEVHVAKQIESSSKASSVAPQPPPAVVRGKVQSEGALERSHESAAPSPRDPPTPLLRSFVVVEKLPSVHNRVDYVRLLSDEFGIAQSHRLEHLKFFNYLAGTDSDLGAQTELEAGRLTFLTDGRPLPLDRTALEAAVGEHLDNADLIGRVVDLIEQGADPRHFSTQLEKMSEISEEDVTSLSGVFIQFRFGAVRTKYKSNPTIWPTLNQAVYQEMLAFFIARYTHPALQMQFGARNRIHAGERALPWGNSSVDVVEQSGKTFVCYTMLCQITDMIEEAPVAYARAVLQVDLAAQSAEIDWRLFPPDQEPRLV